MSWLENLYQKRFTVFMVSLCAVLFGNLIFPEKLYVFIVAPIFLLINILTGILLVYKKPRIKRIYVSLLLIILLTYLFENLVSDSESLINYIRFAFFFLFYAMVTIEVISQVWCAKKVNETVILGLISGYICLGLLGFFLFMSIEIIEPGSIDGLGEGIDSAFGRASLIYFSYITLMTIGYGEIVPVSDLARNASVLLGLLGQFYLVIITAIVVGKFLGQKMLEGDNTD